MLGVTRERVRQIEIQALRRLRHPQNSHSLREFAFPEVDFIAQRAAEMAARRAHANRQREEQAAREAAREAAKRAAEAAARARLSKEEAARRARLEELQQNRFSPKAWRALKRGDGLLYLWNKYAPSIRPLVLSDFRVVEVVRASDFNNRIAVALGSTVTSVAYDNVFPLEAWGFFRNEEAKTMTRKEMFDLLDREHHATVQGWLDRGDGVAVYCNQNLGSPAAGHRQFMSFGSPAAQFEASEPPRRLPDSLRQINWAYQLEGTVR